MRQGSLQCGGAAVLPRSAPILGRLKPRRLDAPSAVSLEELIPANHVSHHLEATLALSFVRDWAEELCAEHRSVA